MTITSIRRARPEGDIPHERAPGGFRATAVVAALLTVAACFGLFAHGTYKNNAFATAAFRGADLVSLVVDVPLLVISMFFARRGSRRAFLVMLGGLAYVAYTYLYAFAMGWSRLFPVYLVLMSLSIFTIGRLLVKADAGDLASDVPPRTPVRPIGMWLWTIGGLLGLIEIAQIASAVIGNKVPDLVVKSGHPTGVVYLLDLGFVIPLLFLAGWLLRKRTAWGVVAGAVMLVKAATEGLSLLSSNLFLASAHLKTDGPLMGFYALIALGSVAGLVALFRLRAARAST